MRPCPAIRVAVLWSGVQAASEREQPCSAVAQPCVLRTSECACARKNRARAKGACLHEALVIGPFEHHQLRRKARAVQLRNGHEGQLRTTKLTMRPKSAAARVEAERT
jgi:hypothetical protein